MTCVLTFFSTFSFASGETALEIGLSAVKNNNQKTAVKYLLPLAQKGDVQAMYYLGALFIEADNIVNHKALAKQFLTAASKKGHLASSQLLQQLLTSTNAGAPSVANKKIISKALPTEQQIQSIRKMESSINIKLNGQEKKSVKVDIFVNEVSETLNMIIADAEYIENLYPEKFDITYYIKISDLSPYHKITSVNQTYEIPKNGFNPDIDGSYAKSIGVYLYPSIIISGADMKLKNVTPAEFKSTLLTLSKLKKEH
jgi:hypothetical protein